MPRTIYKQGNIPQQIKNIIPTGIAVGLIALPPVKTGICKGIKIAKAKNPERSNKELNNARNTLIGHSTKFETIQSVWLELKAGVNNPKLELPRNVPESNSSISSSKVIL